MPILQIRGVTFRYPGQDPVLRDLTIDFPRGSKTVVLGRNGAGKSTLFSLCNGLQRPERGDVLLAGESIHRNRRSIFEARRRVGLVFQNPDSQLISASVREDVAFGPMNLGLSRQQVVARVEAALESVGLTQEADRPVHSLSFGQKKRACIAGVLAMEPEVLILDEPTAGLDPAMCHDLLRLLAGLKRRGVTLVAATHDLDFAYAWGDQVRILDRGELAQSGPVTLLAELSDLLASYGLSEPAVATLWKLVREEAGEPSPRSMPELIRLLSAGKKQPF